MIGPSSAPTSSPMPTTVAPTLCESPEGDFITFLLGFASGLRSLKALKLLKLMRALRAAKAARAMKSSANLSTFEAAKDGSLEGFKKALRRARNMEVEMWKRNKWGETPLHVAASAGSSQIVKFIINHASCAEHGVDVRDSVEGRTPLWNACYDSRRDASELLLMSYADLSLMPLRGEYKGIPAQQIIKNKKWDDLVERAVRKRTAEQEARRLRGEAINRFENAALIRIQEAEAAKQAAIEREAEKVRKRCERAFALTHKCLVQLEKKSLQRVFKIWMPGVFTAEELDKIRRGLGEAAMRKARATRLAMLVTDPAILQERMLAKQRAIEEARVQRLADAESRKYKNKMRSGGMRDEWEAAAAAELAALEEAEAEAAAKAAAASGSSDAAPMRTRAKSTSREDKLGDDGSHSGSHGGEEWHAPSRPRTPAIPPEELELRRLRPFPRAGWPPPTIGWRGEKDQEKTYDALEKARAKEAEDALVQELISGAWVWTDHSSGIAPGDTRFRSDGTFVLPSCGNIHGKWWMTGPETFSLYWVKHPSAPKGLANTVPFTRQGDGSWHMPYGSKVTLRNREALPQDTRGRGFHPFLHGTFYNAKCKYESLVASGMCVTLNPREWHGSASIARTSAMPNQGQPDGHGHGDSNWLDQPMRKGGAHEGIVLAIDGDPASCVLFVVNHENLLYLHCHGNKSGQVMLHNWIAKSSGAGVDWFPDCSKWRIRSDGKLQALTHAPPGPHVVGWKSQKAWLVHERDSKALTFDGGALGGEVGWWARRRAAAASRASASGSPTGRASRAA